MSPISSTYLPTHNPKQTLTHPPTHPPPPYKQAPSTFRVGIAGAPVTSWDGYDTHYTER